jgi:hypothetical protein
VDSAIVIPFSTEKILSYVGISPHPFAPTTEVTTDRLVNVMNNEFLNAKRCDVSKGYNPFEIASSREYGGLRRGNERTGAEVLPRHMDRKWSILLVVNWIGEVEAQ